MYYILMFPSITGDGVAEIAGRREIVQPKYSIGPAISEVGMNAPRQMLN